MVNFNKEVFQSTYQNVSAGDINLVGALSLQNSKNFNRYVLSQIDAVVSGLQIVAPPTPTTGSVTVKAGFALYSTPSATTTIPLSDPSIILSYQGAVIEITNDLSISVPSPNGTFDRFDCIDLIYTEIQNTPASRNFINPINGIVSLQTTSTKTQGNSIQNPGSSNTNIVYTTGTASASPTPPAIPANSIRLAVIRVVAGGTYNITQANITQAGSNGTSGVSGTLPRLFELQNFPVNSANPLNPTGAGNFDQSVSLADSLASIRYQLKQIMNNNTGSNWYTTAPLSLNQLLTWAGNDTGITNAYVVSISNYPSTLVAGMRIIFVVSNTNTGASTLSVNGGAPKTIVDSVLNNTSAGILLSGQTVEVIYNGTFWQILNVGANSLLQKLTSSVITTSGLSTSGAVNANISSSQNNYSPAGFDVTTSTLRLNCTGVVNISGIAAGASGQQIKIINNGTFPLRFTALDSASSSANQFFIRNYFSQQFIFVQPNDSISLIYDNSLQKWVILGNQIEPTPHYKQSRWWAMQSDVTSPFAVVGVNGFSTSAGSLSTSGHVSGIATLLVTGATSGNQCVYSVPSLNTYTLGHFYVCGVILNVSTAWSSFIGFSSGNPILNGTDPLAGLKGFGIWFVGGGTPTAKYVHNNGSGTSIISTANSILVPELTFNYEFFNLPNGGGVLHNYYEDFSNPTAPVFASSSQVPAVTPFTPTFKPFFAIQTNVNSSNSIGVYSAMYKWAP